LLSRKLSDRRVATRARLATTRVDIDRRDTDIGTNNVELDKRKFIYIVDRIGGADILALTGEAAEIGEARDSDDHRDGDAHKDRDRH
jgi:hypothetical protein